MDAFECFPPIPDISPADWRPDSPLHSPAWRWLRAHWLHETGRRATSRLDDAMVIGARDFLAGQAGTTIARRSRRPDLPNPAIRAALALARDPDPLRRGELDAHLLTELPFVEVGRRLDLSTAVVSTYHDLFYAVRDQPLARDWILIRAVGCGPWNGFAGPQSVGIWKYAAFSGGPLLLELLIAVTTERPFPTAIRLAFGRHADESEARMRLLARATVALMVARGPAEIETLLAFRAELDRLDERASGRTRATTRPLRLMARFLRMVERSQASPRRPVHTPSGTEAPRPSTATARPATVAGPLETQPKRSRPQGVHHVHA
jgi:hypothetical protein